MFLDCVLWNGSWFWALWRSESGTTSSSTSPDWSCTGCISTDSQPAGWRVLLWGKPGWMPGLEGCTGPAMLSMSQTTGAWTRAICCPFHLHFHLMLCQQLAFFTPWSRLILPSSHEPKAPGSAGQTPWLLFWFLPEKTKSYTSLKQSGIIYHKPSSKATSSTYCNDQICLSTLHECVWVISIN